MAFEKHILINKHRDSSSAIARDTKPKIPVSLFMALLGEYIREKITQSQVRSYIEEILSFDNGGNAYVLEGDCLTDINTILATIDSLPAGSDKLMYTFQFRHVFEIAETDSSLYSTQEEVAIRLGFIY